MTLSREVHHTVGQNQASERSIFECSCKHHKLLCLSRLVLTINRSGWWKCLPQEEQQKRRDCNLLLCSRNDTDAACTCLLNKCIYIRCRVCFRNRWNFSKPILISTSCTIFSPLVTSSLQLQVAAPRNTQIRILFYIGSGRMSPQYSIGQGLLPLRPLPPLPLKSVHNVREHPIIVSTMHLEAPPYVDHSF